MGTKIRKNMLGTEQIKQQFINAAIINSEASSSGDYKTANKQAKLLRDMLKNIENGKYDKNILVELLNHKHVRVSGLAAIDLLRIGHETNIAVETLKRITKMDESKMAVDEKLTVMAAKIQLKSWIEKGYVSR